MDTPLLSAVIVAAGSSNRMGFDKLLAPLHGHPVVWHSLLAFSDCTEVSKIILVCREGRIPEFEAVASEFSKCKSLVAGGDRRVCSVLNGLEALGPDKGFVAIHDAARPLIRPAAISTCFSAAVETGAAACGEPITDSLHRVDARGFAVETVSRENLRRMQTPQIFRVSRVLEACRRAIDEGEDVTDETCAVLRMGDPVQIVETPGWNFKITFPRDLELAGAVLASEKLL